MLEQAVIDATALKESAVRNAQNILIEKYSQELKQTINSLLEEQPQEDPTQMMMGLPPSPGGLPPMPGAGAAQSGPPDPTIQKLPMKAFEGEDACPCPDDGQEIEIKLDDLFGTSTSSDTLPGLQAPMPPSGGPQQTFNENERNNKIPLLNEMASSVQIPQELATSMLNLPPSITLPPDQDPKDAIHTVGQTSMAGQEVDINMLKSAISDLEKRSSSVQEPEEKEKLDLVTNALKALDNHSSTIPVSERLINEALWNLNVSSFADMANEEKSWQSQEDDQSEEKSDQEEQNESLEAVTEEAEQKNEQLEVNMENVPLGHGGGMTHAEMEDAQDIAQAQEKDHKFGRRKERFPHVLGEPEEGESDDDKDEVDESLNIEALTEQITYELMQRLGFHELRAQNQKLKEQNERLLKQNTAIKKITNEGLRKLSDMNAENMRLGYANTILKNDSLNERQKVSFVEAIEETKTIAETKAVFSSLLAGSQQTSKKIDEPATLNEAISHRKTMTQVLTARNSQQRQQPESPVRNRLQVLAGIRKADG